MKKKLDERETLDGDEVLEDEMSEEEKILVGVFELGQDCGGIWAREQNPAIVMNTVDDISETFNGSPLFKPPIALTKFVSGFCHGASREAYLKAIEGDGK